MIHEQNNHSNYITELIKRIDRIQRNVIRVSEDACIGCEMALLSSSLNTVPISIYTNCCEAFQASTTISGVPTSLFRIESVKDDNYVTLRLLEVEQTDPTTIVGTNRTIVVDINAIIAIQCFDPISIEPCTNI